MMMTLRFRLALALVLAATFAGHANAETAAPAARVLQVTGVVEVTSPGQPGWRAARANLVLAPGAALRTGDSGRAEVALASGTVRVYENSLLRVPGDDPANERVRLRRGAALFDIVLPRGREFRVETPEAVAAVKGTRFLVERRRGGLTAGVYDGVVELREIGANAAAAVLVREGFAAMLGDDAFELVVLDRPDPWREWERGTPAPELVAPAPAAQDDGGAAHEAALEAVREASDAVLDSDGALRAGDAKPPANQDADADSFEPSDASLDVFESEPTSDPATGGVLERPDETEPVRGDEPSTAPDASLVPGTVN